MTTMEIVLLICGAAIFIISFFVPDKKAKNIDQVFDPEEISRMSDEKIASAREKIYQMADEASRYALEKTENSMDRISNEKMMALNEYSESVLNAIEKNHQEVVFLYDMLNERSVDLKNTVREAQQVQAQMKETFKGADEFTKTFEEVKEIKLVQDNKPVNVAQKAKEAREELSAIEKLAMNKAGLDAGKRQVDEAAVSETPASEAKAPAARSAHDIDLALDEGRSPGRNKNEMILKLHRQGKSNVEVARELGLGMGEVKLVIDLFEGPKGGAK